MGSNYIIVFNKDHMQIVSTASWKLNIFAVLGLTHGEECGRKKKHTEVSRSKGNYPQRRNTDIFLNAILCILHLPNIKFKRQAEQRIKVISVRGTERAVTAPTAKKCFVLIKCLLH